jgi:hypothetical protein
MCVYSPVRPPDVWTSMHKWTSSHFSHMESKRSRIEYKTSEERRTWLREYAQSQHKRVNEILDSWVDEHRDSEQPDNPTEAEAKRLEKALSEWENKYEKLNNQKGVGGLNDDDAFYFADFLSSEAYKDLNGDWQKIRLRFLEDFNSDPRPGWMRQWGITEESQIIDVCRQASDLHEAKVKRDELRLQLNTLYRTLGRGEQAKGEAANGKSQPETPGNSEVPS